MPENYYVRGDSKSLFEGMTKEEILAAITQMAESGTIGDIDSGFITKIKEIHNGYNLRFWVGTSAEYNALAETEPNVLYITTDDTSAADINNRFTAHDEQLATQAAAIAANTEAIAQIKSVVTYTSWVGSPELAAGEKIENSFSLTAAQVAAAAGADPVVLVSPVLAAGETYDPRLKYYGYFQYNQDGETGRYYFGVYNTGTETLAAPDMAVVVI